MIDVSFLPEVGDPKETYYVQHAGFKDYYFAKFIEYPESIKIKTGKEGVWLRITNRNSSKLLIQGLIFVPNKQSLPTVQIDPEGRELETICDDLANKGYDTLSLMFNALQELANIGKFFTYDSKDIFEGPNMFFVDCSTGNIYKLIADNVYTDPLPSYIIGVIPANSALPVNDGKDKKNV